MVWEILVVWITAVTVPTVLVLAFLRNIRSIGASAFDVIQAQLKECRDREATLLYRIEALEAEIRSGASGGPRQIDVSLSVTPGSEISLTPPAEPK